MKVNPELHKFLTPYDSKIQILTIQLREFITNMIPDANELIWDNYNAVAIAYSKSEKLKHAFCHISVYSKHVNFGFNRGAELKNYKIKLEGKEKLIRHFTVKNIDSFPKDEIKKMILESIEIISQPDNQFVHKTSVGKSIIMSISEKKIRPKKK